MCAAVSVVPAGKPVNVPEKSAVAAVTLPAASFVRLNVIVIVPEPVDSALLNAGTSFAGDNCAVKSALAVLLLFVVEGVVLLPHAAAPRPSARMRVPKPRARV